MINPKTGFYIYNTDISAQCIDLKQICIPLLILILGFFPVVFSQDTSQTPFDEKEFKQRIHEGDSLQLPFQFVAERSEKITIDTVFLIPGKDYTINYRMGIIHFSHYLFERLSKNDSAWIVTVQYKALPFSFKKEYRHREKVLLKDSISGGMVETVKTIKSDNEDIFKGTSLQKSGSLVRGLTIGSNRDLSVNSGFRLQMSGNLTDDIKVLAALTDENTPIQPEGATQTLQEFDKAFVELSSKDISATLGDFNLNTTNGEFGTLSRKLQGAKLLANYRTGFSQGDVTVAGAATRGKYHSNTFLGIDGVQGPYRLTGKNGERDIIVIAGTERVYINGETVTRGETNDYTIEYGIGEVTFTSRRLITSATRITVDFEYTDRQYNRTLLTGQTTARVFKDNFKMNFLFFRESDDKDSPVDLILSDSDKIFLRSVGDNRLNAVRTGVDSVGRGKGQYVAMDSIIFDPDSGTMVLDRIYRYNPVDTLNAVYSVKFSYVGAGNGDYNKISISQYIFAGKKKGSYLPVYFLPLPQEHSVSNISLSAKPAENLILDGEFAHSEFDLNRFSDFDDENNGGNAYKYGMQYSLPDIKINNSSIGNMQASIHGRYLQEQFIGIDRVSDIEYDRKWGLPATSVGAEDSREYELSYSPKEYLSFSGEIGTLDKGNLFSSKRNQATLHYADSALPHLDYLFERTKTNDHILMNRANWFHHRANIEFQEGSITGKTVYENESRDETYAPAETLTIASYRYHRIKPSVILNNLLHSIFTVEYGWRWDDSLQKQTLQGAIHSFTQHYGWQLQEWHNFSSNLDLTINKRTPTELWKNRIQDDFSTTLLRWQSRYNPFDRGIESDWYYEAANERTSKMERIFQRVPKGSGNYAYAGDLNNNHVIDEPDFQPTRFDGEYVSFLVPGEGYVPVVDLKASSRIRFNGSRLAGKESFLSHVISLLSSETYLRIEERNTTPEKNEIYFLHVSKFLDEHTTLSGSNFFSQDFYVLENDPAFSLRFRYSQRKGLTQLASQNEATYARERSIRLRWSLIKEISNQTDFSIKDDNLASSQFSSRARNVTATGLSTDWSYRPSPPVEVGFKIGVGTAGNQPATEADLNDQSLRFVYSFEGKGQGRVEFSREEAIISNSTGIIPYELTNGRFAGKSWIWRLSADYKLTDFIQGTLNYEGRIEGERDAIHTARAEVKAFF